MKNLFFYTRTFTGTYSCALSLSYTHTHSLSLIYSHTLSYMLTHTYTHTHALTSILCMIMCCKKFDRDGLYILEISASTSNSASAKKKFGGTK